MNANYVSTFCAVKENIMLNTVVTLLMLLMPIHTLQIQTGTYCFKQSCSKNRGLLYSNSTTPCYFVPQ